MISLSRAGRISIISASILRLFWSGRIKKDSEQVFVVGDVKWFFCLGLSSR